MFIAGIWSFISGNLFSQPYYLLALLFTATWQETKLNG
jgi:hypothetical protein